MKEVDATWSLFLDRDGVINKRVFGGYITDFSDFVFLPGVLNALNDVSNFFSHVFIVTNQQGVGKGIMTLEQLELIHQNMLQEIQAKGGRITKVYAATELKNSSINHRKPNSYMGLLAQKEFPFTDLSRSIMIGDTDSDIRFGKNCGMKTILQLSEEKCIEKPDGCINNLIEFRDALLNNYEN